MNKTTSLTILQQSEYDLTRWQAWLKAHQNEELTLEPADWTLKLKLIHFLSHCFFFLPVTTAIKVAFYLTQPAEFLIRQRAYARAQKKLKTYRQNGLQVVAIAGSYAKTSTKQILEHTLSGSQKILVTPKSINTMLGVAQVIEQELKPDHTLFVVEFGEYHPGDIYRLANFVQPDYGILTPIGHQHLEILGGFEQVVNELRSFVTFFASHLTRVLVHEGNRPYFSKLELTYYGEKKESQWQITDPSVSRAGTEFSLVQPQVSESKKLFSPLFGEHQAVNTLPSFWLAEKMSLPAAEVQKRVVTLPYIHRRHEPTFAQNDVLILDNSYNTNADSVQASLKLLNQLKPTRRLIVTLGFTETGVDEQKIHYAFGRTLVNQSEFVGMIKAPWTQSIIDGFLSAGGKRDQIVIGKTQEEAFAQLQGFIIPGTVILFEGGYQEIYV